MKRIATALCVILLSASFALASPAPPATPQSPETETATGKVVSVSDGSFSGFTTFEKERTQGKQKKKKDKAKNLKITITDEKGERQSFSIRPETSVIDKNDKKLELSKIHKDDTVTVAYAAKKKKGACEAVSIKLVKPADLLTKISGMISFGPGSKM